MTTPPGRESGDKKDAPSMSKGSEIKAEYEEWKNDPEKRKKAMAHLETVRASRRLGTHSTAHKQAKDVSYTMQNVRNEVRISSFS